MTDKTNLMWGTIVSLISLLSLLGCTIETKKNDGSSNSDVAVSTPLGSLSVQSTGDARKTGLKLYPGATVKPDNDSDHHSNNADIAVSSPLFGMTLVVQKFETTDSPEKVTAFYEKELSKFGKVIKCNRDNASPPSHDHEQDGPVSCDNGNSNSTDEYQTELKVGTEKNQHIVAVKPQGKGAGFALVYVRVRGGKKGSQ